MLASGYSQEVAGLMFLRLNYTLILDLLCNSLSSIQIPKNHAKQL